MSSVAARLRPGFEWVCEFLWAIALIFLPITTFPLFSSLTGAQVTPLSILPFIILFLVWTLPIVLRNAELPRETIPLILFTLVVILSCAAAYFIFIPGFKGKSVFGQEIRALFTLAVGLVFYLVTTTWLKTAGRLNNTWKYITIGGILSLVWAGIQAFYIFRNAEVYPSWMNQVQSWISILSPTYSPKSGRINGLTYEASWFAHQMVMLYLPLWAAATFHRSSAFKFRLFHISIENILLIFGLVAFFLSSPRIGLISLLLMAIFIFFKLTLLIHRKIVEKVAKSRYFQSGLSPSQFAWIRLATSLFILLVYFLVIGGALFVVIHRDWRLSILVTNPPTKQEILGLLTLDQTTLLKVSQRFIFLERMVYWLNGWNVFNHYPWLGVGLGNAGFFFPQLAPSMGWATFEIRTLLFYLAQLPNVKSLWLRLLAETGLVGFSVFLSWLYVLFRSAGVSQRNPDPTMKTFAFAGQLVFLALIGEGFSIDSFAMPYLWVVAGLVASVSMIYRKENLQAKQEEQSQENPVI